MGFGWMIMMWMIQHPWMAFFIMLTAIVAVDGIVAEICKTVRHYCEAKKEAAYWRQRAMEGGSRYAVTELYDES